MRGKLLAGTALSALTMLAMTDLSGAAESDAADSDALPEVVVTAQKRSEKINDVGFTIQAFNPEQLENAGVHTTADLGSITPGLTVTDAFPHGVPVYTIRGVGFDDYTLGGSSTVGLYFDEVSYPSAGMTRGALFDVDQVEVLKGPQGDLYGRNTTAGQINVINAKPTTDFEAGTTLDYERYNVVSVDGYVSGPLTDMIQGRLAAKITESPQGYQESISRPGDYLGKQNAGALRGALNFNLSDTAKLLLSSHWIRDKSENLSVTAYDGRSEGQYSTPGFLPGRYSPIPYFSTGDDTKADWNPNFVPQRNSTLEGVSAKLDWDVVDGINLASISALEHFNRDKERFESSGVPYDDAETENTSNIDSVSEEIRLSSTGNSDVSWIVGGFYSHDDVNENYFFPFKDSYYAVYLGINQIDSRNSQTTDSIAGFAHTEWKFADQWKLVLGGRITDEARSWTGCTYDTGDGSLAGFYDSFIQAISPDARLIHAGDCAVYDDIKGSTNYGQFAVYNQKIETTRPQGRIGLNYNPTSDALLYATISRGTKSGGFNGAAANTQTQLIAYKPETLTAYEIGAKTSWLDRRLNVNLSGFYYDYIDKQEPGIAVTPVGDISGLTNVPKSEILGSELELHARVTQGLTIDTGLTYLHTEILQYEAISTASVYPDIIRYNAAGYALSNAPRWQGNATATYTMPIADDLNFRIAGDVIYKANNRGSTQDYIASYTLFNARVGLSNDDETWSAMLYGRNITNKYYWLSAFSGNGTYARIDGTPAIYGISVTHRF